MKKLELVIKNRRKYKVSTDRNHKLPVAENVLDRAFYPEKADQVWAADITYI